MAEEKGEDEIKRIVIKVRDREFATTEGQGGERRFVQRIPPEDESE